MNVMMLVLNGCFQRDFYAITRIHRPAMMTVRPSTSQLPGGSKWLFRGPGAPLDQDMLDCEPGNDSGRPSERKGAAETTHWKFSEMQVPRFRYYPGRFHEFESAIVSDDWNPKAEQDACHLRKSLPDF